MKSSPGSDRLVPARRELGRPGRSRLTTWSKERGKRQSEFGMEMQSHEVSGGNADSPEASNTGSLVQSPPAQGNIVNTHGLSTVWNVEHLTGRPGPGTRRRGGADQARAWARELRRIRIADCGFIFLVCNSSCVR